MGKVLNIIRDNGELVASVSGDNIICHNNYRVKETNEDETFFRYTDTDGTISLVETRKIKNEIKIDAENHDEMIEHFQHLMQNAFSN